MLISEAYLYDEFLIIKVEAFQKSQPISTVSSKKTVCQTELNLLRLK